MTRRRLAAAISAALWAALPAGCGAGAGATPAAAGTMRIGAVFPQHGSAAELEQAGDERLGVEIARDLVNAGGGVGGKPVELVEQGLSTVDDAPGAIEALRGQGVETVVGAYSSSLSIAASEAAARRGMLYWEAGAVADRLTGRGLPMVFRVGADGAQLGDNSLRFTAEVLAPRLGRAPSSLTVGIVAANDDYATSVAAAAAARASAQGMRLVSRTAYDAYRPSFDAAIATLRAARPDILVLASHVADGVAFRRAFLAAGLHVDAFLGSTMAECGPDFGAALGPDAIGVFASDRPGGPDGGFDPTHLNAIGRADYARLAAAWTARHGGAPDEEALSGFSAAWALLHDVLPAAARSGGLGAGAVAAAARGADLAPGTLADGAGLRFAADGPRRGQNTRSAAVIWQWQAVRHSVVVWPEEWRSGAVAFVPLPR